MSSSRDFPFDVFLSHASEDKKAIRDLARSLRSVGVRPWVDEEQMPPGTTIEDGVAEGIKNSRHLLTWITSEWVEKVYPKWELRLFSSRTEVEQRLIPVLRIPWEVEKLGPFVSQVVALGSEVDGPALLWKVYCGIRGEPPGAEEDWMLLWNDKVNECADALNPTDGGNFSTGTTDPLKAWRIFVEERFARAVPWIRGIADSELDRLYIPRQVTRANETESLHLSSLLANCVPDMQGLMPRFLLVAEPGAGKTTALRHLALDLARTSNDFVPVYVSLSRYESSATAVDFLTFATQGSGIFEGSEFLKARSRQSGLLVLLLDGLDEVTSDFAGQVVSQINVLIEEKALSGSVVIVASRPVAIAEQIEGARLEQIRFRTLDEGQRKELIQNIAPEVADALWERINSRPRLAEFVTNPLTLTLLAEMGRSGLGAFPSNSLEVHDQTIDLMLQRKHSDRSGGRVRFPDVVRRLLPGIALRLYEKGGEIWSYAEVQAAVAEAVELLDMRGPVADIWRSSQILTADIVSNSGVLGAFDGILEGWRFLHRSTRDYLIAQFLSSVSAEERNRQIWTWVEPSLRGSSGGARWGPILGFLAGMIADPMSVLDPLAEVEEPQLLRSILRTTKNLPPGPSLGLLLRTRGWGQKDLDGLAQGWEDSPENTFDSIAPLVRSEANDCHLLGAIWYTLEAAVAEPDRGQFFEACGRSPAPDAVGTVVLVRSPLPGDRPRWFMRTPVTLGEYKVLDPEHSQIPDDPRLPVVGVSWYMAKLYAAWVGGRLPSVAEWNAVLGANTGTESWTGGKEHYHRIGWNESNSGGRLHPVGCPPTSAECSVHPWGLQDMIGNVFEWCHDEFDVFGELYRRFAGGSFCCPPEEILGWAAPGSRAKDVGMRISFGRWDDLQPIDLQPTAEALGAIFRYQSRFPDPAKFHLGMASRRDQESIPSPSKSEAYKTKDRRPHVVVRATKRQKANGDFATCWIPSERPLERLSQVDDSALGDLFWVPVTTTGSLAPSEDWVPLTKASVDSQSCSVPRIAQRLMIFDFDGTLADCEDAALASTMEALHEMGMEIPMSRIRGQLRVSITETLERLKTEPSFPSRLGNILSEELSARYYERLRSQPTRLYSIVPQLLQGLSEAGVIIGVLSNSRVDRILRILSDSKLDSYVRRDLVIGIDDTRVSPKPSASGINLLMDLAKVSKENTSFCGDGEEDREAAASAGVKFLVPRWSETTHGWRDEIVGPRDLKECAEMGLFESKSLES